MRYILFLFLFISLFTSAVMSVPTGKALCVLCGEMVVPRHTCPVIQQQDVKTSNANANVKRLEEKYDDDKDKDLGDLAADLVLTVLNTPEQMLLKIGEFITGEKGSVECQGCSNWVSEDLEHWGTGGCAIGHVHWTCRPSERWLHDSCTPAGSEPETDTPEHYGSGSGSGSQPPSNLPTHQTTYETGPCGHTYELRSSAAYSHRLVSCPLSASNQACSYGSYYVCSPHDHAYGSSPSSSPPPSPSPSLPAPEPPKPKVVCPANSWTNCGGTVSHATTCPAGHTYYTCNPDAVSAHSWHRASPVMCPANAWTNCRGTVSHATVCGEGHTYYTCNPSAVSAHSGHKKIVCPAHSWTNCGGATLHARTCGRGHTYYTCNPDAVQAHKWH